MDRCNLIKPLFLPNKQLNVPCFEQSDEWNQLFGVSLESHSQQKISKAVEY